MIFETLHLPNTFKFNSQLPLCYKDSPTPDPSGKK